VLFRSCCSVENSINGPTTAAVRALGGIDLDETGSFAYQSTLNSDPDNNVKDSGV